MPVRTPTKGYAGWMREKDRPPMRLDDLVERLGERVDPIREALGGDTDLAVVLAHALPDGADFVLVATKGGMHVRYLCPDASDAPDAVDAQRPVLGPDVVPWSSVRVSPVRTEGWQDHSSERAAGATHSCEVRIGEVAFVVSAVGTTGRWAVDGFHDEVVRRGTPWHYPS